MSRAERVLLVSTLYPPNVIGGAEVVVRNLAEGLHAQGHEVCVATLARHGDASDRIDRGVRVKEYELRYRYWPFSGSKANIPSRFFWHVADNFDPSFYIHLRTLIRSFAPTVVNTHNISGFTPAVWVSAHRTGHVPIVHTCHDYGLLCSRTTMFHHGQTCKSWCTPCRALTSGKRYLTRLVDGVVGVSKAVLEPHLERQLFARACRTRVIHNAQVAAASASAHLPSAHGPLRLGFMGRLSVEKGIVLLYEELAGLGSENIVLQVAGRGDTELVDRLATERAVPTNRLGFVPPETFYEKVDVLIVPSLWQDPLPTVVLEAFRHGVPVVVSNRGGLPELVERGKNGFVFDPTMPGELKAIVQRLQNDRNLLRRLSTAAMVASNRFTIERMIRSYVDFYREVREHGCSRPVTKLAS